MCRSSVWPLMLGDKVPSKGEFIYARCKCEGDAADKPVNLATAPAGRGDAVAADGVGGGGGPGEAESDDTSAEPEDAGNQRVPPSTAFSSYEQRTTTARPRCDSGAQRLGNAGPL